MLGNQWDLNFQDILVKMTVSGLFDRIAYWVHFITQQNAK